MKTDKSKLFPRIDPTVIRLYDGEAPGSEDWDWREKESRDNILQMPAVYDVAVPTLTYYGADEEATDGTAVIIAPGGGFQYLSFESEGTAVAQWLNSKGIAVFVLKYRLMRSSTQDPIQEVLPKLADPETFARITESIRRMAVADGKKAVQYVRGNASRYKLDPARIGFMGFSAGGTLALGVGHASDKDARPDFLAAIYPYIGNIKQNTVRKDAPPIFICVATDDDLALAPQCSALYSSWINAKRPAEFHGYARGGHGFGIVDSHLPVNSWIERFYDWLQQLHKV